MKISGFSFVRNGIKLYYPIIEAVKSILPIVDEFVIAVGKGDDDDTTRELLDAIDDPKVRILDTEWDPAHFKGGIVNSIQTDIAKKACTGDWLFYLQSDEVVHEKYLPVIKARCEELLDNYTIDGLLFKYRHFWGDYGHYHAGHGWYPNEIRIIRNDPSIHSWQSAQSFRRFDYYKQPRQPEGHHKIRVASVDAEIFHYGWVRPPHLMQNKKRALDSVHWGLKKAAKFYDQAVTEFDYGPLDRLAEYTGTHPAVMKHMIAQMNWADKLQLSGVADPSRKPHKHELFRVRFQSFLQKYFLGGRHFGTFKNYILVKNV